MTDPVYVKYLEFDKDYGKTYCTLKWLPIMKEIYEHIREGQGEEETEEQSLGRGLKWMHEGIWETLLGSLLYMII